MSQHNHIGVNSAELSSLWSGYHAESLAICMLKSFVKHVEDLDIKKILETSLNNRESNLQKLIALFQDSNLITPTGFTDKDVLSKSPRLYNDSFFLFYLKEMARFGMMNYAFSLNSINRKDLRDFYSELVVQYTHLSNQVEDELLRKGLSIKSPYIPLPDHNNLIDNDTYLTGWFGKRRPLNTLEITHIYLNILRNVTGRALLLGFSQTAESEEVRKWMYRGVRIADKTIEILGSLLSENNLPAPMTWDTLVTTSTSPAYTDRLMMFHVQSTNGVGIADYGMAIGMSMRRDLGVHYVRLAAETLRYGEDGLKIMIEHGWLEQPPQMVDRQELSRV